MADIFSRLSKFKVFVLQFKSKIKPIEDNMSSSETTIVSQNSLNERNVESKENNYRRDSFDDRFCDDLSEVILQFLPFGHKLRLEFVSKQFQRTVFKRQYELYINTCPKDRKTNWLFKQIFPTHIRDYNYYYYIEYQSLRSIKSFLKKCPNLSSIKLKGTEHGYSCDTVDNVFRMIIENCNNLNEIKVMNQIKLGESIIEEFHRKFGPKIKFLSYYRPFLDLSRFPNIEKIICLVNHTLDQSIIPKLKTNKLKQIDIVFDQGKEQMLKALIDDFPTLTHLSVYFKSKDENAIYESLKNISNLKQLIHFKLQNQFVKNNKQFYEFFNKMAENCQNLKSIDFDFHIKHKNPDIRQLFSQLKSFPALKRLSLTLHFYYKETENIIYVNQLFLFKYFEGFSNITHLSLGFIGIQISKKLKFEEIDINLPKLQYLEIRNQLSHTPHEVQQLADNLSRLSRLETLKLRFYTGVDFKPIKDKITKKCRKIRKIEINQY